MPLKTITILGAGECISSESEGYRSREQVTLAITTVDIPANTVLGKTRGTVSAVATAKAGNTGNGAMPTVTPTSGAKKGRHILRITAAAANAGSFIHEDPDGQEVGTGTVAVAYNKGNLAFTLPDGATDWAIDDIIYIDVAYAADGQYKPLDPAATDGSADFAGILYEGRFINTAAQRAVALVRSCVINANKVNYGATISDPQKAVVEAQAALAGVIFRR